MKETGEETDKPMKETGEETDKPRKETGEETDIAWGTDQRERRRETS